MRLTLKTGSCLNTAKTLRRTVIGSLVSAMLATAAMLTPLHAENAIGKITIPFVAKEGSSFVVTTTKERTDRLNGADAKHFRSITSYNASISKAGPKGLTIIWTPTSFKAENLEDANGKAPFQVENLAASLKLALTFETDTHGIPVKIVNRQELQQKILIVVDKLPDATASKLKQTLIKALVAMPEADFAKAMLQDAFVLGSGQALDLPRDGVVDELTKQPNPIGGPPVDFVSTTRVTSETDQEIVAETKGRMDEESFKASLEAVFTALAKQQQKEVAVIKQSVGTLELAREDVLTYRISKQDGWTREAVLKKSVSSKTPGQDLQRIDTMTVHVDRK